MDAIQDSIKDAESKELDYQRFLKHIPEEGPWERLDGNDEAKDNPIERYVGPGKARLMNTNLFLGSSWIDTQRFKFERRIDTPADFIRQKTVVNANMWTPKQVATTQDAFLLLNWRRRQARRFSACQQWKTEGEYLGRSPIPR